VKKSGRIALLFFIGLLTIQSATLFVPGASAAFPSAGQQNKRKNKNKNKRKNRKQKILKGRHDKRSPKTA